MRPKRTKGASGAFTDASGLTAGSLRDLGPAELVQILVLGRKTGCLRMATPEAEGRIWFEDGVAVHAVSPDQVGDEAFCEMITWTSGTFAIEHGALSVETTITEDAMLLVMEAMRQVDEAARPADEQHTGDNGRARRAASVARIAGGSRDPQRPVVRKSVIVGSLAALAVSAVLAVVFSATGTARQPVAAKRTIPVRPMLAIAHGDAVAPEPPPADLASFDPAPSFIARIAPIGNSLPGAIKTPADWPAAPLFVTPEPPHTAGLVFDVVFKGKFKRGSIVLLLDGHEVLKHEPADGDGWQIAAAVGDLAPGAHEVVARVVDGNDRHFEKTAVVDLGVGETRTVRLVMGRWFGAPLTMKIDERDAPYTPADESPIEIGRVSGPVEDP